VNPACGRGQQALQGARFALDDDDLRGSQQAGDGKLQHHAGAVLASAVFCASALSLCRAALVVAVMAIGAVPTPPGSSQMRI